uniref:Uncharacterized protein n=1 Tax=Clytia hemisphaerica TaxID=252671 RepID=A0A7M5V658_9CNID
MHHLVPLVKTHGSPSTNERTAFQHSTNQKAAIPQPTNEEAVTNKRQVNEDLQVYKMENGTRNDLLLQEVQRLGNMVGMMGARMDEMQTSGGTREGSGGLAALQAAMQQQQASVQANALQMGNMRSQAMLASTL